jgi:hypothetical protein
MRKPVAKANVEFAARVAPNAAELTLVALRPVAKDAHRRIRRPDGGRRLGGRDPTSRDEPEGNGIGVAACSFYQFLGRFHV